jgi:hypothetical protein
LIPRDDRRMNAHASYHTDGMHHVKSYGSTMFPTQRQPLDQNFRGSVDLFAYSIQPGWETQHTLIWRPKLAAYCL